MAVRKVGSHVLLDGLIGRWEVESAGRGGYWIRPQEAHPYHPIVLAEHGYFAELGVGGYVVRFWAPGAQVHNAYDRSGVPFAVPVANRWCPSSGRRASSAVIRKARTEGRNRVAWGVCETCAHEVRMEWSGNRLGSWEYVRHEGIDVYNELGNSLAIGLGTHGAAPDRLPGF